MPAKLIHVVYCEDCIYLDKAAYQSWRAIQDEYVEYKTSLGPFSLQQIMEFFVADYGENDDRWPFSKNVMNQFFESSDIRVRSINRA